MTQVQLYVPDAARHYFAGNHSASVSNALHLPSQTCKVCATPVDGYSRCAKCNAHFQSSGASLADRVGAAIYAVKGQQSYHHMLLYKTDAPGPDSSFVVNFLLADALLTHGPCLTRLAGRAPDFWATVPSLPPKQRQHPLNVLAAPIAPGRELTLVPAPSVQNPRALNASHFSVEAGALSPGAHVLVIEDSWVTGGHPQSAALAVRTAGADQVSLLTVARVLDTTWPPTATFLKGRNLPDYSESICCWTGAACPA